VANIGDNLDSHHSLALIVSVTSIEASAP